MSHQLAGRRGTLQQLLRRAPGSEELALMCRNARAVASMCDRADIGKPAEELTDQELRSVDDDGWYVDRHGRQLQVCPPDPPDGAWILPEGA